MALLGLGLFGACFVVPSVPVSGRPRAPSGGWGQSSSGGKAWA